MQWTDALVEDFARFAAAFETDGFVASTVHEPEEIEPGTLTMPWWEYSDVVSEWHQALYEHGVIDAQSDYLSDESVARMIEFEAKPSLIGDANLPWRALLRRLPSRDVRERRRSGGDAATGGAGCAREGLKTADTGIFSPGSCPAQADNPRADVTPVPLFVSKSLAGTASGYG